MSAASTKAERRVALAGERITAKAAARMRRDFPMMRVLLTNETCTIAPKTDTANGQWACADCGEMLQNNMQAHGHPKSHRLAWWTGTRFEEP